MPLFVSYYRRGQPRFIKARDLIAEGAIGSLTDVTFRHVTSHHVNTKPGSFVDVKTDTDLPWRLVPEHSGGGLVMDVGCHALDAIDYIAGDIHCSSGNAWRRGLFPSTSM